jgi:ribosomal protein S18 acetylase RimI-like enzyme
MRIEPACPDDIAPASACLAAAFIEDTVARVLFDDSPIGQHAAMEQFFGFLLEARLALGAPVLIARDAGRIVGLVMGDATHKDDWPADIESRFAAFKALHPDLAQRFATYDAIVDRCGFDQPHYHLGLLGVDPACQGKGHGKALVKAFLTLSDGDPESLGTNLETGTPENLGYYESLGFDIRGSGPLGDATLWCLYRVKPGTDGA